MNFVLNGDGQNFHVNVSCPHRTLLITVDEYGTNDKNAAIIQLEYNDDGKLMLHVRSDIHHDVPTHRIDLEGARENRRKYFPWGGLRPNKDGD